MTLRELRNAVLLELQKETAIEIHNVPDTHVVLGKTDGDTSFPMPSLVIYVRPIDPTGTAEDNISMARQAEVTVFGIVEPERDAAEAEMNAVELCEKVEKVLTKRKNGFFWTSVKTPQVDGSYADYAVAFGVFNHNYTSSAT